MSREPDDELAIAIEMTNLCKVLGVLPRAGGLLDQDAYDVYMMQAVLAAQAEREELEAKKRSS